MRWQKQGLIYCPNGDFWWAKSYAHLPTADIIDDKTIRIYYAALDDHRYGRIGYIDCDIDNPSRILHIAPEPVMDLGELGCFDDSGVNPSCIININGKKYLYYIGWQRCERVPYMLFLGLATSDDGKNFTRLVRTPILDRTPKEPFLRSANTVLYENGIYRCWYVSGVSWIDWKSTQYPSYVIRYAESTDGLYWEASGHVCIDYNDADEFGFGRPWIIKDKDIYRLWYSIRSRSAPYRIGYAESQDGLRWTRKDNQIGIERSTTGWDSEMICYPCIVDAKDRRYMFYNGNRHGATGFGYAVLDR
jgi:hypothetical protein